MRATTAEKPLSQVGEICAHEFVDTLSAEERDLFQEAKVAETLLREVEDADTNHGESAMRRKVSPAVLTFISGVMQYAPALDVFANSNTMLCPIWGSVRVVLHLAKEFGEYFDRLATMLEEIGNLLKRLPRALRLYPDNQSLQTAVMAIYKGIFDCCIRAKHVFRVGKSRCQGLLAFQNAVNFVAAIKLVWKPFDVQFGDIKKRIAKNVTAIESEADMAEKELAREERSKDDVRWSKAEASQKLLAEYIDDQSMTKVNEWLAPANVATNHKAATGLRHGDSGTWFLHGPVFQRWLKERNSFLWLNAIPGAGKTILASSVINYLRDQVQSKDTALAYFYCDYKDTQKQEPSKILGTLLASFGKQNRAVFEKIQQFFLQHYKETSTFTAEFDELLNHFGQFIHGQFQSAIIVIDALDESGTANMECISYALKHLQTQCKSLKIFVTSRNELLIARAFQDLPSTSIEQANVESDIKNFITAELSAKIRQRRLKLRDPTLELVIRDSLVQGSGGMFQWAKCQIDALCKLRNDKAIRAALSDLPKTLQDTYLRILQRVEDDHPEDIDTVRKILCWLVKGYRKLTLDELAEAVSIDVESDETNMDFDAVDTDPEQILEVLGGLVTVFADKSISLAHYSVKEYLVSEDLQKTKKDFWVGDNEAEADIASICLTYLCYDDFKRPLLPDVEELNSRLTDFKLYRYATQAWAIHAHRSEVDGAQPEQVVDLTMRLLASRGETQANYDSWIECYRHCKFSKQTRHKASEPLFVAAYFGLTEALSSVLEEGHADRPLLCDAFLAAAANGHAGAVKVLLEYSAEYLKGLEQSNEDVLEEEKEQQQQQQEEEEEEVRSPAASTDSTLEDNESIAFKGFETELPKALYSAAAKGHSAVVSLLLSHGAPIDARGGRDGTALQAAALEGRGDVVKLLLNKGANHWEPCKRYGTPLAAAAEKAHQRTFNILLENGAKPNSRGGWYALPLVSAIVGKNMNIIRKLIEAGADLNSIGGRHGGPLPAAAAFGMNNLIKELVESGAKVNDGDDKASDALYAASLSGHVSTVDLLLDLGADVGAKGGRHRNALGAACSEGHLEVATILLNAGADVDFHDERWGNALQIAAQRGHEDVVRLLVDAGMDPNAPPGEKGSALVVAAASGHEKVIQLLFDVGVDSGETDETISAMVAAAMGGHCPIIQLLFDKGADINGLNEYSQTASYCTPIQAAAAKGHIDVVKLLIELGVEVNEIDNGWYGTALKAALFAPESRTEIVMAILDAGADVNEVSPEDCHNHGTALAYAVSNSDLESTKILLDKGADANLQWNTFLSPLQEAVYKESDELVDILIEHGADVNLVSEPLNIRPSIEEGLEGGSMTAIQTAAWCGHRELVRRLFCMGAKLAVDHEDAPFVSALQTAAYCGHTETVKMIIELECDVNERGGYFGSALQAAACRCHLETVEVLLKAGAHANEVDVGYFHSALLAACMNDLPNNIQIVELLVEHGADVNQKQKGPFPYPLHATSRFLTYSGNDPYKFLLKSGADPNAQGGRFGTSLQAAASRGGSHICITLLDAGADPNITGGWYNTPLQAAYRRGWYIVIAELYKRGATNDLTGGSKAGSVMGQALGSFADLDDNSEATGSCPTLINQLVVHRNFDLDTEYGCWGNALQNTVVSDRYMINDEIVMLLNAGANVNKVGGYYGTAFNAAAAKGELEIMKELFTRGADLSLGNHRFPNAAFAAIVSENMKVLEWVLEKGVDVKDPVGYSGTSLQYAAILGNLRMVRRLIRAGASINTPACGRFGTPLQGAIVSRKSQLIHYLLRRGADTRAKGGLHGGIMNAAAAHCLSGGTDNLVRYGGDVNEPGRIFGSPLQAAAASGELEVVLTLLRHGADINLNRGKYGTALQAACAGGFWDIAELLIQKGADVNIVGGRYRTALHAAAIEGFEDIARSLLEDEGAEWSLCDRRKLGHISPADLDEADELLQRAREPPEDDEDSEWEDDEGAGEKVEGEQAEEEAEEEDDEEEDEEESEEEEEDTSLPWNVDSIPDPLAAPKGVLSPHSRWNKVQELSFHSFSQHYLRNNSTDSTAENVFDTLDSAGLVLALHHRVDSTLSNGSSATVTSLRKLQSRTSSRKTTMDELGKTDEANIWDSSVLDDIQLVSY